MLAIRELEIAPCMGSFGLRLGAAAQPTTPVSRRAVAYRNHAIELRIVHRLLFRSILVACLMLGCKWVSGEAFVPI